MCVDVKKKVSEITARVACCKPWLPSGGFYFESLWGKIPEKR